MRREMLFSLILAVPCLPASAWAGSCWNPPALAAAQETRELQAQLRRLQQQQADGSLSPEDYASQHEAAVQAHKDRLKSIDGLTRSPPPGIPVCPSSGSLSETAPAAPSTPGALQADTPPTRAPIGVSEGDFVPNSKLPSTVFHAREMSFPGPQPTERWRPPEIKPIEPKPAPAAVVPKTDEGEHPDEAPAPD